MRHKRSPCYVQQVRLFCVFWFIFRFGYLEQNEETEEAEPSLGSCLIS